MTEDAIKKINTEMQKAPDDPYREIIGHYIIDRCVDPACAEQVLKEGKTLEGAMKAVTEAARNAAKNGVAVRTPAQVFGEVDRYFGLAADPAAQRKAVEAASGGEVPSRGPEPVKKMALDLADFL